MSRAERLLSLVQMLRRYRAPVSAQTLADALGVSQRSIYRDVNTLREQGAQIEGEAGLGYMLRPGFLLPPLMFSDIELEALVLGLRLCVQHADTELGEAARDVAGKLRAVLPKESRTIFDEVALLAGPALERPVEKVDLTEVRRSLRAGHKARIDYTDAAGAISTRIIWPLGLAFFERSRMLVAWCEQRADFRTFRLDRMLAWHILREPIGRSRMAMLRQWRARENIPDPVTADKN